MEYPVANVFVLQNIIFLTLKINSKGILWRAFEDEFGRKKF